ncbi:MAG TPA: hypothetical protein VLJ21_01255 [Candidatus Binatia bacterium]|nr:hypothetical protein [Candidatus Binatia bacterium]
MRKDAYRVVPARQPYRSYTLEFSKTSWRSPRKGWLVADALGLYILLHHAKLLNNERLTGMLTEDLVKGLRTATTIKPSERGYEVKHHLGIYRGKLNDGYLYEGLNAVTRTVVGAEGLDARLTFAAFSERVAQFELGKEFPQTVCFSNRGIYGTREPEGLVRGMRIIR